MQFCTIAIPSPGKKGSGTCSDINTQILLFPMQKCYATGIKCECKFCVYIHVVYHMTQNATIHNCIVYALHLFSQYASTACILCG